MRQKYASTPKEIIHQEKKDATLTHIEYAIVSGKLSHIWIIKNDANKNLLEWHQSKNEVQLNIEDNEGKLVLAKFCCFSVKRIKNKKKRYPLMFIVNEINVNIRQTIYDVCKKFINQNKLSQRQLEAMLESFVIVPIFNRFIAECFAKSLFKI